MCVYSCLLIVDPATLKKARNRTRLLVKGQRARQNGLEELSQGLGDAIVDVQRNAVAREGAEATPEWDAVIGDCVRALVKALIKYTHRDDAECVDGLKTTTRVDATLQGIVYTSPTAQ